MRLSIVDHLGLGDRMSISMVPCFVFPAARKLELIFGRVNSKATIRFPMKDLLPLVPNVLHQQLLASPYYAESSHTLIINSDESRKASENTQKCFEKLCDIIKATGKRAVRGETSLEQAARVENL